MNQSPLQHLDGDGRVGVSLAELIGLRARVAKLAPVSAASRSSHAGPRASRLYGRGMDYAESRVYQPGDDVRRLDWRLTARSGRLHTKLFQEEREGRLLVLVDTHASMYFGTRQRFKSVQAARVAALAAWYAVRAGDRVGLLAFGQLQQMQPPQGGSHGALAICGALAQWDQRVRGLHADDARSERLSDALGRARRLGRGAHRILLISDGLCCDDMAQSALLELSRQAEVAVVAVADALESQLVPAGRYPVEQGGRQREVNLLAERQRVEFQRRLGGGMQRLSALTGKLGLRLRPLDTAGDPLDPVLSLLGGTRGAR